MAILTGFRKFRDYLRNADGTYSLKSLWTSAQTVECSDGDTVEDKIGALKGITADLTTAETGYAADITAVGKVNTDLTQSIADVNQSIADINASFSQARADLITALASKGVTVAENCTFTDAIEAIHRISSSIKVTKIGDGTSANFRSYAGYQNFRMWQNIFVTITYTEVDVDQMDTARCFVDTTGGSLSASYNSSTGSASVSIGLGNNLGSGRVSFKTTFTWYLVQII